MLGGHSVWLTPIFRGRVSHSDSGLNTVGGVLSCPWFVNDWHSLRIMPLEAVLIWRDALCKPQSRMSGSAVLIFGSCANHRHARVAPVMLGGHSVWLTPISRGRVSHSDSGLNTVGGVLSCPWFVNDWHSLRIMPLDATLIWRDALCKPQSLKNGSAVLIFGSCANPVQTTVTQEWLCCFDFLYPVKPCANHRHARVALVMLGGHSVWLTPISRGRVSHSDSGLNTVGGVLSCPWFVNDCRSLRIMPLEAVLIWREALCKPQSLKNGSAALICLKCSLR